MTKELTIQTSARPTITAVGTLEDFEANVSTIRTGLSALYKALAQCVAYAYAEYHRGGDDRMAAIDRIRAEVRLPKASAAKLSVCLSRIPTSGVPEGETVSKAALTFANEFATDFIGEVSKARQERRAAAKAAKAAKAEATKAAKKAEEDASESAPEGETVTAEDVLRDHACSLIGVDGRLIELTPDEFQVLMLELETMRSKSTPKLAVAS